MFCLHLNSLGLPITYPYMRYVPVIERIIGPVRQLFREREGGRD